MSQFKCTLIADITVITVIAHLHNAGNGTERQKMFRLVIPTLILGPNLINRCNQETHQMPCIISNNSMVLIGVTH